LFELFVVEYILAQAAVFFVTYLLQKSLVRVQIINNLDVIFFLLFLFSLLLLLCFPLCNLFLFSLFALSDLLLLLLKCFLNPCLHRCCPVLHELVDQLELLVLVRIRIKQIRVFGEFLASLN